MTGTELATRPVGALALDPSQGDWTPKQRAALDQLGVAEAPDGDKAVFLHQAQRTGLDPFTKQIYMIGRWDPEAGRKKWTIQTGIDGLRVVAERHGQYGGQGDIEWCGEDGVWRDVWVSNKPPVAARATVIRRDWPAPVRATAHFREYAGYKKDGQLTRMWREKGALMIAKCAEALALRKAFPQDLSGLYTAEEMDREPIHTPSERADRPSPAEQPPDTATTPAVDWEAELAAAAGDYEALRALWSRVAEADPDNSDLQFRIMEAGKAAKTAAEQQPDEPVDAEIVEDPPTDAAPPAAPGPELINERMLTKLHTQLTKLAVLGPDKHRTVSLLVDRDITSTKDLTKAEGMGVIDVLDRCLNHPEPAKALDALLAELASADTQSHNENGAA